jgi:hypothetical protein
MDIGPSGGFLGGLWDKIRPQLPGMVNAVGSSMPGPWGQASQATGKMMANNKKKKQGPGVNPSAGAPNSPYNNVQFGGMMPGGNTGITGGMMGSGGISPLWGNYGANPSGGMQPPPQMYPGMPGMPGMNRQIMY